MSENLDIKIWVPTVSEIPRPVPKDGIPEGNLGPVITGASPPGTLVLCCFQHRGLTAI